MTRSYISLRGNFSDELREINFCRNRLGELLKSFEKPLEVTNNKAPGDTAFIGRGRKLFASGCQDLQQAVEQYLGTFAPNRWRSWKNAFKP